MMTSSEDIFSTFPRPPNPKSTTASCRHPNIEKQLRFCNSQTVILIVR